MGERKVSFPVGETTFTEFIYRQTMPDGTIVDTPPNRVMPGVSGAFQNIAGKLGGVRMERTVTVVASEWTEVL